MSGDEKARSTVNDTASAVKSIVDAIFSVVAMLLLVAVLFTIWSSWADVRPYLASWLKNATHIGIPGISIDRQLSAEKSITQIAQRTVQDKADGFKIDTSFANGAIARASRSAAAIRGARILWVDPNPQNNDEEASILRDMGIEVQRSFNTTQALKLLQSIHPDIIISDVGRDDDVHDPLQNCPAHYFAVPIGLSVELAKLNADTMAGTGKARGFSMAEAISKVAPLYTNHFRPRLIYYSASTGGLAASQCARIVTNRADVLLQSVVSVLEELNWEKLKSDAASQ
jgi:hypothetical protein